MPLGNGTDLPQADQAATFMINMTKEEEDKAKGDKTHGDERIQQIKGESKRNIKNDRHNFTVDLRKKKR